VRRVRADRRERQRHPRGTGARGRAADRQHSRSLMEPRRLGRSDLQVPVFALGPGNFGGKGGVYEHRGSTDVAAATRLVDICLDHGLTLFDTADAYAGGASEETLGAAIKGGRGGALFF